MRDAAEQTIVDRTVTYDIERQIEGGERLATSEYAEAVVDNIEQLS